METTAAAPRLALTLPPVRCISYRCGGFIIMFATKLHGRLIAWLSKTSRGGGFGSLAILDLAGVEVLVGGMLGFAILLGIWDRTPLIMGAAIEAAKLMGKDVVLCLRWY